MKSLFEQMGGTYSQQGDCLIPNITLPKEENQPIGIWGQRHQRHLKQHRKILYTNLLTSGKLNSHLAEIDKQAEDIFFRVVKQLAKKEGVTKNSRLTTKWNGLVVRIISGQEQLKSSMQI